MSPDFEKCRYLARQILKQQPALGFNIRANKLKYDKNIIFESFQTYSAITKSDMPAVFNNGLIQGGLVTHSGTHIVLWDKRDRSAERLNWTCAHEVGHVYLEHKQDGELEEVEAHFFAAELLAPECMLFEISRRKNRLTVDDVLNTCFITPTAATKRVNTLKRKNIFDADQRLLRKLDSHITDYCGVRDQSRRISPMPLAIR